MRTLTILLVACLGLTMLAGCKKDDAAQAKAAVTAAKDGDTKPLMAMVDDAKKLVNDGKLDEAQKKLTALQDQKDLPKECKAAVTTVEAALKAAKAKDAIKNIKLPGTK